jgi:hypothetical protein
MPDSIHNGYCLYETCSPLHPENIKIVIEDSLNIYAPEVSGIML